MAGALRIVSVERGHDPRDFALVAFGGAGPVHAARLAEELEIPRVLIPPIPGGFSALGLVATDFRRDYVQHLLRARWPPPILPRSPRACAAMEGEARAMLSARRRARGALGGRARRRLPLPSPGLRADGAAGGRADRRARRSRASRTPSTSVTAPPTATRAPTRRCSRQPPRLGAGPPGAARSRARAGEEGGRAAGEPARSTSRRRGSGLARSSRARPRAGARRIGPRDRRSRPTPRSSSRRAGGSASMTGG